MAPLQWGDAPGDNDLSALGGVDVAIGSDICYEEACVGPLAALLERIAAPLTLLIGPVGRSSYALLRQRLKASSMLRTEERLLSLVCNNADDHQPATVHSAGVHSLLIVRRDDGDSERWPLRRKSESATEASHSCEPTPASSWVAPRWSSSGASPKSKVTCSPVCERITWPRRCAFISETG